MHASWKIYKIMFFLKIKRCVFSRYIAKTETADIDMDYISRFVLQAPSQHIHRNQRSSNVTSPLASVTSSSADLPLFEQLGADRDQLVEQIEEMFSEDMQLFGYALKRDPVTNMLLTRSEPAPQLGISNCWYPKLQY